ncbi:hypothetical protein CsSME_00050692 [Camellia sinensis var. sinensis]
MEGVKTKPLLHTLRFSPLIAPNRVFAVVYTCAILALLYHHAITVFHSTTLLSFSISITLLISDVILGFMWAATQSFRMNPVHRQVFPENLEKIMKENDLQALDIFVCTADPYKEPPMSVVNTALSVMAYDYPTEKLSIYVSDDGGSAMTLFAFMEAAKFGSHWLPFCRRNKLVERCPDAYFRSNHHQSSEAEQIKMMYESMKARVENVVERGKVGDEYITNQQQREAFNKWNSRGFTRQDHPTVIQVLLEIGRDKDITGASMPNLIYVSRHKSKTTPHHFKAGALNALLGFRYGSLVEDYYTGYRLQCEGWKSVFCHPNRAAFLGDVPINLNDVLSQTKRWCVGLLEVGFSKHSPVTFGSKAMGPLMGLCYAHYAFWPIWSIPITIYAFLPQLTLLNGISIFPKVSDIWFFLYIFLFIGSYGQDCLDYILAKGTFQRWWSDQRMWLVRGVTSYMFGLIEFISKYLGIATQGFNVTSKVVDNEQGKRYNQGTFEFGVESPMFMSLAVAAIINLTAFVGGLIGVLRGKNSEGLFGQLLITGFVVLNCCPVYEAMVLRTDKGRMPTKTTIISTFLAWALYTTASLILKI